MGKRNYEAGFMQDGKKVSVVYDAKGQLKETETRIPVNDLPANVTSYMKQHYSNAPVKEAAKITKADGTVMYEAEVNHTDVLFDAGGKFLKKQKG